MKAETSLGDYDHINTSDSLTLELGGLRVEVGGCDQMRALVAAILRSNHGLHRFMSELARQLPARGMSISHQDAILVFLDAMRVERTVDVNGWRVCPVCGMRSSGPQFTCEHMATKEAT